MLLAVKLLNRVESLRLCFKIPLQTKLLSRHILHLLHCINDSKFEHFGYMFLLAFPSITIDFQFHYPIFFLEFWLGS
jgi:hypothetical protein